MEEIYKVYKEYFIPWNAKNPKKIVIEVSNYGNVKRNGELLELNNNLKYLCYGKYQIHRMVAEMFIPNPENKLFIDHIDTNKHNNRADNLRWVTSKENSNNILTKQHQSENHKGKNVGKRSEETKKKMSEAAKRRIHKPMSEETKKKISEAQKGKIHKPMSEETKQKLREYNLKNPNRYWLGKKRSEEDKQKMILGWMKKILYKPT